MVKKIPVDPTYKKDSGLWNLDTDSLPLPYDFKVRERNIVYIPSGQYGGNHKHPRTEAFVGMGEHLFIVWQDDDGSIKKDKMMDGDQLYLIMVEPHTPHAVINEDASFAILFELADGPNVGVERAEVLETSK